MIQNSRKSEVIQAVESVRLITRSDDGYKDAERVIVGDLFRERGGEAAERQHDQQMIGVVGFPMDRQFDEGNHSRFSKTVATFATAC